MNPEREYGKALGRLEEHKRWMEPVSKQSFCWYIANNWWLRRRRKKLILAAKKAHRALRHTQNENAATLETIAQYVANVLNDPDSLPDWWTPHTVATTINRIITAAPMPAELQARLAEVMEDAGKEASHAN